MTGTYFETFMAGGVGLVAVAILAVAWLLWRQNDTQKEAVALSLEGIGHEFRFNMFQTVREIGAVDSGDISLAVDLPRLAHPQLDGLLDKVIATDKRALAAVQATYESIEARKRRVRVALNEGEADEEALDKLKTATIDGISTLYLWEKHEGCAACNARSTRSWWVRDWMKAHGFAQDLMPGLALRDAVVDHLRAEGMVLTPKPLSMSAYEYYSRPYDRKADPRGVFGKRRFFKKKEAVAAVAGEEVAEAEEIIEAEEVIAAEDVAVEEAVVETVAEPEEIEQEAVSEAEPDPEPLIEAAPELEPEPEPAFEPEIRTEAEAEPEPEPRKAEEPINWAAMAAAAGGSGVAAASAGGGPVQDDAAYEANAMETEEGDEDDLDFDEDNRRASSSADAAE